MREIELCQTLEEMQQRPYLNVWLAYDSLFREIEQCPRCYIMSDPCFHTPYEVADTIRSCVQPHKRALQLLISPSRPFTLTQRTRIQTLIFSFPEFVFVLLSEFLPELFLQCLASSHRIENLLRCAAQLLHCAMVAEKTGIEILLPATSRLQLLQSRTSCEQQL